MFQPVISPSAKISIAKTAIRYVTHELKDIYQCSVSRHSHTEFIYFEVSYLALLLLCDIALLCKTQWILASHLFYGPQDTVVNFTHEFLCLELRWCEVTQAKVCGCLR
jgi:hypothetical protein